MTKCWKPRFTKATSQENRGSCLGYRSCGIPHGMSNCFVKEARAFQPVFYFIKNYFEVFKFFIIKCWHFRRGWRKHWTTLKGSISMYLGLSPPVTRVSSKAWGNNLKRMIVRENFLLDEAFPTPRCSKFDSR